MAQTTVGAPDTIVCSSCWTGLPAESHFCSACGAQVSSTVTGVQRLPALLSEANLYRMRARWVDAENRCIEALRLDPNNVDGHSLLGDIYRDQGKLEDAAQWYQLALDLNPKSIGDKTKLAELDKQRNRRPATDLGVVKASMPAGPTFGTQRLLGLPPSIWLQAITIIAIVFVVIVIGAAISMSSRRSPAPETIDAPQTSTTNGPPMPLSGAPAAITAKRPAAVPPGPSPSAVMPIQGPIGAAPAPAAASEPAGFEDPPASPVERTTVVRHAPPGATDYEKTLRDYVTDQARLGREVTLGAVTVDPRHPRATIIVSLTSRRSEPSFVRLAAIKNATRVALAGLSGDPVLNSITINVRLKSGDRFLPVFAGDAERLAVQSLPTDPSFDQMLAAYSSYWWAPSYAPPGLPQSTISTQP